MRNSLKKLATIGSVLLFNAILVSCEKEARKPKQTVSGTSTTTTTTTTTTSPTPTTTTSGTSTYTLSTNWNTRADGLYSFTQAAQDLGSVVYWNAFNSQTTSGMLRTTLAKYTIGPSGGAMSRIDVPDAAAYQLNFDMMFDSQFDWSAGGKVGFGLFVGEGNTGADPGWDGNGGSARLMWYKGWDGRIYLKPYLYYKDQPDTYGNDFGKTYPATGNLQKGVWYNVKMYVKGNTGSNTDGRIQVVINGTTLIDQAIRWTTNDAQRFVKNVSFENFRGGAETYWQSSTDGNIFFDNVSWSALQ